MIFLSIPLTLFPLLGYAVLVTGSGAPTAFLQRPVFSVDMLSGMLWQANVSDLFIALGLFALLLEVIKATRTGSASILDHVLSMLAFVGALVAFLVWPMAATSTFALLTAMALIDVVAGFWVALRTARRDIAIGHGTAL